MSEFGTSDARRIILAVGRNVGTTGDEGDLADLAALRLVLDDALGSAVVGMRQRGLSWSNLGDALGVSKSAVYQRYGSRVPTEG